MRVYQNAMEAAMKIFELTKDFPPEEKYSMVDQMRRSSRSVCANLAEAWRKRRYKAAFVAKLSDAESEACETQVWIEFAKRCGYLEQASADELDQWRCGILCRAFVRTSGKSCGQANTKTYERTLWRA